MMAQPVCDINKLLGDLDGCYVVECNAPTAAVACVPWQSHHHHQPQPCYPIDPCQSSGHNLYRSARYGSNTATWASNQISGLTACCASNGEVAKYASNMAAFASNTGVYASNMAAVAAGASNMAGYASNVATWGSNNFSNFAKAENKSNWDWASNTAAWVSNTTVMHAYNADVPTATNNTSNLGKFVEVVKGPQSSNIYFVDAKGTGKLLYDAVAIADGKYASNVSTWLSNNLPMVSNMTVDPNASNNPPSSYGTFAVNTANSNVFFVDYAGNAVKLEGPYASNTATWLSNNLPNWSNVTIDPSLTGNPVSTYGTMTFNLLNSNMCYIDYTGRAVRVGGIYDSNTASWASNLAMTLSNTLPNYVEALTDPRESNNATSSYGAFRYNTTTCNLFYIDYTGVAKKIEGPYASNTAAYSSNVATWLSNNLAIWSNTTVDPLATGNPAASYGTFTFNTANSNVYFIDYAGRAVKLQDDYDSNTAAWASNLAMTLSNNLVNWSNVTADPALSGNAATTYGSFTFNSANSNVYYIDYTGAARPVARSYWTSSNSNVWTLSNVGIGTSTPNTKFEVEAGEVSTCNFNSYRIVSGSYGTFWRNAGGSFYLMSTPEDSPYGGWSNFRPFTYSMSNGSVRLGDTMYVEDTNMGGYVGIGTFTPGYTLDVAGNVRGSNFYAVRPDTPTFVWSNTSGSARMYLNSTTLYLNGNSNDISITAAAPRQFVAPAMIINGDSNYIGFHCSPDISKQYYFRSYGDLCVATGPGSPGVLATNLPTDIDNGKGGFIDFATSRNTYLGYEPLARIESYLTSVDTANTRFTGHLRFFTRSNAVNQPLLERMIIRDNGDVGINTYEPQTKLHVNAGEIATSSNFHSYRHVTSFGANTRGSFWRNDGQSLYLMGTSNNDPWGGYTGYRPFQFNMSNGTIVLGGGGLPTPPAMFIEDHLNGGQVGFGMTGPTYQIHVATDSAAKPGTSTWTVASDARLKEDIQVADIDTCYSNVKQIPLKYYKWRDDVYDINEVADRHKLGWIAQDVEQVFPKAVSQKKMLGFDDCRDLNTDQLYASMYGAIQKLQQLVENQGMTIADYESVLAKQSNAISKQASTIAGHTLVIANLKDQTPEIEALKIVVAEQTQKMAMMTDSVSNMIKVVSQLINAQQTNV
jgi:hypothetical protein